MVDQSLREKGRNRVEPATKTENSCRHRFTSRPKSQETAQFSTDSPGTAARSVSSTDHRAIAEGPSDGCDHDLANPSIPL